MPDDSVARVNYFDGQFLRTQEFVDEQAYHLAALRRHEIAEHGWGIVTGLVITQDTDRNLAVAPGRAVDGYGREVLLPFSQPIAAGEFTAKGSATLEVWLQYAQVPSDAAPRGYAACGTDPNASPYRIQEVGQVVVRAPSDLYTTDPAEDMLERRRPPGVPDADIDFIPVRTPPDAPERVWPIYLGSITRTTTQPPTYSIDLGGRPYAGLIGEAVVAPSRKAWVQIGAQAKSDRRRFAVFLDDGSDDGCNDRTCCDPCPSIHDIRPPLEPRLSIDDDGDAEIRGNTTLFGDLTVDGGAVEFGAGPAYCSPHPWRIYHVGPTFPPTAGNGGASRASDVGQGNQANAPGASADVAPHELRIEMAHGMPTGHNKVVIGTWSEEQGAFMECFAITDDCSVTIKGNLVVEGALTAAAGCGSDRTLSPEAAAFGVGTFVNGVTGALDVLRSLASTDRGGPAVVQSEIQRDLVADGLIRILADSPELVQQFARLLKRRPDLEERLRQALERAEDGSGNTATEETA